MQDPPPPFDPGSVPPGAAGLDRALELEPARAPTPSPEKRDWVATARALGIGLASLVITAVTTWNAVSTHFADGRIDAAHKKAKEAHAKVDNADESGDSSYRVLAVALNAHADKLEEIEEDAKRIQDLADYIEWSYSRDEKRYGKRRLERMLEAYFDEEESDAVDETEAIMSAVMEIARRQEVKRGGRISLPKKVGHVPTNADFYE